MSLFSLPSAAVLLAACVSAACGAPATRASYDTGKVAVTYFAGFHANRGFPVSAMPWEKFTQVKYAFAEVTENGGLDVSQSAPDQIPAFVEAAHAHNVLATISIGGWTGSRFWSSAVGSPENRTAFVKTCLDFVDKYQLDGFDTDWEYPNRQGLGCNVINKNDTANLLAFFKEIREKQTRPLKVTASASLFPWNDASGAASTDMSGFADVLDYAMIMGYDIWGPWLPTGGPASPLRRSCDSRNNQGSLEESVDKWIAAGMPANKLVMGVPAFGHGFSVNVTSAFTDGKLNAYPAQNASHRFQGGSWDTDPAIDLCGNANPPGGTYTFANLVTEAHFLNEEGTAEDGIDYGFDSCAMTPFVYNKTSQIWVTYDDAQSATAKAKFMASKNLLGFATWEAGGDYKNILVDALRSGIGM
ncbi:family 18 glycosyl hydrolase [Microdochium bolleyi]|uniref:chitinase n=1 Tax=Microdochium bolleyi TaxID=196109 RepID=A0A136J8F1_9PEZI|nr:family 18 glycosyl hydrolase [Microdochium bolleyi]